MLPGFHTCDALPQGWSREYEGYLMTGQSHQTQDLCVYSTPPANADEYHITPQQLAAMQAEQARGYVSHPNHRLSVPYKPVLIKESVPCSGERCHGNETCVEERVRALKCVVCTKTPSPYRPLLILPEINMRGSG